ncbi:universal stress protein [Natrinema hispanicum]|uniref:universal stress protein n=1 Tax=Natrinema hispanicum TaxID=392421 RepID=UPI00102B0D27|nr:universal stress protein [Natrinema hispanicum]
MPIVAAIDQSDRARSVIRQARELADAYGVELHVVHVNHLGVKPRGLSVDSRSNRVIRQACNRRSRSTSPT